MIFGAAGPRDPMDVATELRTPPPPNAPYSTPIPNSERDGYSAVYRNWRFRDQPLLETLHPDVRTAYDMFEYGVRRNPSARCLGWRPWDPVTKTFEKYTWMTYDEVSQRSRNFGAGVVQIGKELGIEDEKHAVGLWCQNRPEWQIVDLGCSSQALYTVSLYDTLGPQTTEFIINHANLPVVATSLDHIPALLKLASTSRVPTLKLIVCMDTLSAGEQPGQSKQDLLNEIASTSGVKICSLADVEAVGVQCKRPVRLPQPDDILTINYTSGTTGDPKGVILTHRNAVAGAATACLTFDIRQNDIMVSYLPLAHIYQRVTEHGLLYSGSSIGYFHGDILGLVDDMKLLRPTGFNSVPRLFNRFGSVLRTATIDAPGFKGTMSRYIIDSKLASMKLPSGKATNKHAIYDRVWTSKVASAFGLQRCRQMVTGSAPIDASLQQFLRAAFGCELMQGYGLTETFAVGLAQLPNDFSAGNCGALAPTVEACLKSVPDMEYLATDKPNPRGELLMRGSTLFRGYHRSEAETAKAIDEDGWFHTGDIAEVDYLGRFKIIDRRKNVLKLAQGEYISPERIENIYLASCPFLAQAFVHGNSTEAHLVGIMGVDPITFAPFASKVVQQTVSATDIASIQAAARDPRVKAAVLNELHKIGKKARFNKYEHVRALCLEVDPFTVDNELLTPTLKLKRPQAAKKFQAEIDEMYAEAEVDSGSGATRLKL